MALSFGHKLRTDLSQRAIIPFIGVYDVFSASLAAQYFDGLFLSGFSFAASYYGLPDIGFIAWSDMVSFVQRVRTVLPQHHVLVDIDDGYCDVEVACHVVSLLESAGASGVIMEDQKRPRKCGHFDGKQLLELDQFLVKLRQVVATRKDLVIVARTDAGDVQEMIKRIKAFEECGADVVFVEAVRDLELVKLLKRQVSRPILYNQIAGGKSPNCRLQELAEAGVSAVIYSTPCLFAAQTAVDDAIKALKGNDGLLPAASARSVGVPECTAVLHNNLLRRDRQLLRFGFADSSAAQPDGLGRDPSPCQPRKTG